MQAFIITDWSSHSMADQNCIKYYDIEAYDICTSSLFDCNLKLVGQGFSPHSYFEGDAYRIETSEQPVDFGILNDIGRWYIWSDTEDNAVIIFTEDSLFRMEKWLKFNQINYTDIHSDLNEDEKRILHKFWEDYLEV